MGKALYRRYRPKCLSEVVGQEQVTEVLEKALRTGRIAHAYLFVGPRGTGKTSVARILAHEVNHFDYSLEDEYLDIIEIDAASNTGVDNIRDLREKAMIAPSVGKYKIYIIDEVHMLSKSAFNALLKTLEEPPEHVIFMMATTDLHKVPITIKSRSQTYVFKLAKPEVLLEHLKRVSELEKIKIDEGALRVVAKRSGGSFRDAMSLLDQVSMISGDQITEQKINEILGLPEETILKRILEAYGGGDSSIIRDELQTLLNMGIKAEVIAEDMMNLITESPEATYLGLLSQLIEVPRSAYPEVKLLLALMGFGVGDSFAVRSALTSGRPSEVAKLSEKSTLNAGLKMKKQSQAEMVDADVSKVEDSGIKGLKKGTEGETRAAPVCAEGVNLSSGEALKKSLLENPSLDGVRRFLEESDFEVKPNEVHIYVKRSFIRSKLKERQDRILAVLPDNYKLEILEGAKAVDKTIADIAALMGGGEEVILDE